MSLYLYVIDFESAWVASEVLRDGEMSEVERLLQKLQSEPQKGMENVVYW